MNSIDDFLNTPIIHYVHLHLQQRGGKKVTLIEGLEDAKESLGAMRKGLNCGGSIQKNKENGVFYVQLQGDLRERARVYLISIGISSDAILMHGY